MRILGLDYGSVTVGVAVSDALGLGAQPVMTIRRSEENKLRRTLAQIAELVGSYSAELIVLGLPRNMDDSCGERARRTLEFKEKLEKRVSVPVILWDERLTTAEADSILDEAGYSRDRNERKKIIDQIAAQLILEDYMNASGHGDK
ncbi:MAG: Holliday junction resolvase RuvX [Lachnospiraceae bacterium]|nr:Holliday junction resolvase RuvX [Lachnospiraceae bacterium]